MTAQFGPHRWSAGFHANDQSEALRGASLIVADLRGARFVDCDFTGVKIVDGALVNVDLSGYVSNFKINGIDITAYVEAELDNRHPERVQLRSMQDDNDFRAMGDTVERIWSAATARAEALGEQASQERVDGEWSFVETLRHLIFITDSWASRTILDEPRPYHRLALPPTAYRPADAAALGMELDARPSLAEVLSVRAERLARFRGILAVLTYAELGRVCLRSPAPGYPEEPRPVYACLATVLEEECEHYRFATRDLAVLEEAAQSEPN